MRLAPLPLILLLFSLPATTITKRPQSNFEPIYEHRRYRPYDTVAINDHADSSAGLYFRVSQKGVDYMAALVSDALPAIFTRMVLPNVKESSLSVRDLIITRFDRPFISVKFVRGVGIDLSLRLPHLQVTGSPELSLFFTSYRAQMLANNLNLTLEMRVSIHRNLSEEETKVEVEKCEANPGELTIQYFGPEASEFYSISSMIKGHVQDALKGKLCQVPIILADFLKDKIDDLVMMGSPNSNLIQAHQRRRRGAEPVDEASRNRAGSGSVIDHICRPSYRYLRDSVVDSNEEVHMDSEAEGDGPDVELGGGGVRGGMGLWIPDLTLRYPPTFSHNDFIVGIDGGILARGVSVADFVDRPKFANVTLIRDQMFGLIVSEYVPNTLFYQLHQNRVGAVSITYSLRHVPKFLRTIAKYICSDCRLVITANMTEAPQTSIDSNGVVLTLEGEVGAHFHRKNKTHNLLTSSSELRVVLKPHFRHSRVYSDVLLAGFDLKASKTQMSGLVANAARKFLSWLIPRAIWPKLQQRVRAAVFYKGVEIPRFCTLELQNLHLDYVRHAAIISGDFDVDLALLLRSFRQFMDEKQANTRTRAELERSIRYL